jgi:hypothetical protein
MAYFKDENELDTTAKPTFGGVVTWALAGNPGMGIPSFSTTMYAPTPIMISSPAPLSSMPEASVAGGQVITWNSDPLNDSVALSIEYCPGPSHYIDASLPLDNHETIRFFPDNGSYTITAADLAGFPVGGIVKVTVLRAGHGTVSASGKDFCLIACTISTVALRLTV